MKSNEFVIKSLEKMFLDSSINVRMGLTNKRISQLEKDSEAKEFAINNLKKAKDTLFDRINLLELNLENLKSQTGSDFTRKP